MQSNIMGNNMSKHLTFADIPIGGLFVTGPADTLFIKVDNESPKNLEGGRCFSLADGCSCWTPANRIVSLPKYRDFARAANNFLFRQVCETNQKPTKELDNCRGNDKVDLLCQNN